MQANTMQYWQIKLERCKHTLEQNNFHVFLADTPHHAQQIILQDVLPNLTVARASWGDSLTLEATSVLDILRRQEELECIETFDKSLSRRDLIERRRQALTTDLFLTGTNAVTEQGQLVNLDMIGNRVAGIVFGPKKVIIVVGRNKIVPDLSAAITRIRKQAAPMNAIRHNLDTPCAHTASCTDCRSPQRICNTWTITEKSLPPGRITVILINQDLGL